MEHPFYGSWGYQTTGYFAPTSRYGTPQDLMYLIDVLHQSGIGVILDWVPSHFPRDGHSLGFFDGTHLYEHADPRQGIHPDWDSFIFNYGRNEVRSFLLSSAMFWLDAYHVDGLRVDAVASMLYLDYGRKGGEWLPNKHGGRENLEAIEFVQRFNQEVYSNFPGVQTIAEESTAWPMVSRPVGAGGLGFGLKWDMGWMHDTLEYFSKDPIHRKYHHKKLTFRILYAFTENFVLPLSHDEVVYGKGALLRKMPGDDHHKFANLRLLFAYMYAQPGKKLIFMGGEFGQWDEWHHEKSLDWHLLDLPAHKGARQLVQDLNQLYVNERSLHELDFDPRGFEWMDCNDSGQSTLSFLRKTSTQTEQMLVALNFTPVPRDNFRIPVPVQGPWVQVLNTDASKYGGHGYGVDGVGDFGQGAFEFAEFLRTSGHAYWQILPLNPTEPIHGNSPYHSASAFALNPIFLSPDLLVSEGWIGESDMPAVPEFPCEKVDYEKVVAFKGKACPMVANRFKEMEYPEGYEEFCATNAYWLDDYALFSVIKQSVDGRPWIRWPSELRDRSEPALEQVRQENLQAIEDIRVQQFVLRTQWNSLKALCNRYGIKFIGDMPIYVVHDSADVWAYPHIFNLDQGKSPITVAGVPPDYFSSTGQLWGNPVYRWDVLKEQGYDWWIRRIKYNLQLFDVVRIDHFRGFVAYWEVEAGSKDATAGQWVEAPAWDFFGKVTAEFPYLPIIAEDLGLITPDVLEVREYFKLPGMKVLLFAFGPDISTNPYAPHNVVRNCVYYTGTHDNNTIRGWFDSEASEDERERVMKYLGRRVSSQEIHTEFMRLAMMSVANLAILPMQDILGLGEDARMNTPARRDGNWEWRLTREQMSKSLARELRDMIEIYGRV